MANYHYKWRLCGEVRTNRTYNSKQEALSDARFSCWYTHNQCAWYWAEKFRVYNN